MPSTVTFKVELGNTELEPPIVSRAFDESGTLRYELATAVTDQAVPFTLATSVTTIQALYIFSDQTITYRQVTADTGTIVNANSPHLLVGTSMTALLMSNASGSTANVQVWIGGT